MNKLWIFVCGEPLSIDDKNIDYIELENLANISQKINYLKSIFLHQLLIM